MNKLLDLGYINKVKYQSKVSKNILERGVTMGKQDIITLLKEKYEC